MSDLYKTSLCRNYENGTCANGTTCKYAHGVKELRSNNHASSNSHIPVSRLSPIESVYIFHDGENLAIADGADVVHIKNTLVNAAIKGRIPRDLGAPPTVKWNYFISTGTTEKTQNSLRIAGAILHPCGAKKNAVDIHMKNFANREIEEFRKRSIEERSTTVALIASSDSDYAEEIRNFKLIGIRVGIVCSQSVNPTYRDQADFYITWPIKSVGKEGKSAVDDTSTTRSAPGVTKSTPSIVSAGGDITDSIDEYRQAWCDAIATELSSVLERGQEITMPHLGQVAAPLKPLGAPKSLKLEATLREDERKRFKLNGEGTEIVVTFNSRGKGGGGGSKGSGDTASTHTSSTTKGLAPDVLRQQWCNAIFSKLHTEFQIPGGLSLSILGQLASNLKPIGGDNLRLEASLSEDSRFLLVKGAGGEMFAKLRGRKKQVKEVTKAVQGHVKKNSSGSSEDDLREAWCDEIVKVLEEEVDDINDLVYVSSLGPLVAPLRPIGGESLKLEASLRADSRFEVHGKGIEAVVRLVLTEQSNPFLTSNPFLRKEVRTGKTSVMDELVHIFSLWPENVKVPVNQLVTSDGSPVKGADPDVIFSLIKKDGRFITKSIDEGISLKPEEKIRWRRANNLGDDERDIAAKREEEENKARRIQEEENKARRIQEEENKARRIQEEENKARRIQEEENKARRIQEEENKARRIQEEARIQTAAQWEVKVIDDLVGLFSKLPVNTVQSVSQLAFSTSSPVKGADPDVIFSLIKKDGRFITKSIDEGISLKPEEKIRWRRANNLGDDERDIAAKREEEEKRRQELLKVNKKPGQWVRKYKEGQYATLATGTLVRYGIDNHWFETTIKLSFPFLVSNEAFKCDPAPGAGKYLEVWEEPKK
jgi:hypothetical protein